MRLRKGRERRVDGLFVAEGVREVERALAAGLTARSIYVDPKRLPEWAHGGEEVSDRVLAKMAYRTEPEGVIGVFETPHREMPTGATLILVAVGIEKPGNLGAMARTADAAGVDALLVADAESDPWNPNAIRASTGAVFTLPIVDVTRDDVIALPQTKVAAAVGSPAVYTDADFTAPTAFLIGAEDKGLSPAWLEAADMSVSIPMHATSSDSLNAATSAAILLFETIRQRG